MSINYNITKKSELQLINSFYEFYNHVKNEWIELIEFLKNNKSITASNLKIIERYECISNQYESQILDECIWCISKNQPVASNLRFIISIINSIRDLERMSDYIERCAHILNKYHFNKEVINQILKLLKYSIECMDNIIKIIKNKQQLKSEPIKKYKIAQKYIDEYRENSHRIRHDLLAHLLKSKKDEWVKIPYIIHSAERNIEHSMNILESFIYIHDEKFFFIKRNIVK